MCRDRTPGNGGRRLRGDVKSKLDVYLPNR